MYHKIIQLYVLRQEQTAIDLYRHPIKADTYMNSGVGSEIFGYTGRADGEFSKNTDSEMDKLTSK